MLITIDKTKELTRKEYIDFLQKTKGEALSEARISQLVSAGRLNVRDYPELGNLQLIVLGDDEQALAQARFTTTQAIHAYSYKELGLMFGKLIHDLNNENGNAQTLLKEKQTEVDTLIQTLQQTATDRDQARQLIRQADDQINTLTAQVAAARSETAQAMAQVDTLQAEAIQTQARVVELQRKAETEAAFRSEFEEFKSLILAVLKQQADAARSEPLVTALPGKRKKGAGSSGSIPE